MYVLKYIHTNLEINVFGKHLSVIAVVSIYILSKLKKMSLGSLSKCMLSIFFNQLCVTAAAVYGGVPIKRPFLCIYLHTRSANN